MTNLQKNYLSPATTTCLKGLMALIIVAGHIRNNLVWLNDTLVGQALTISGYLCVAVFFFLSGYGLVIQYKKRGNDYVSGFLKHRLLDVYLKYLFVLLLYFIFKTLLLQMPSARALICSFTFGGTIVESGWYLQAILVLYILFWTVMKLLPSKPFWHGVGFTLALVAYCALCWAVGCSLRWYQSILGFFLGLVVGYNKDAIDTLLAKKHTDVGLLLLSLCLTGVFLAASKLATMGVLFTALSKTIAALFFVIFTVLLLRFVKIENRLTCRLGTLSFEIYVIHGLFLNILHREPFYINDAVYIVGVFACSLIAAVGLNIVFKGISALLRKKM